jgi:hypothetical protein
VLFSGQYATTTNSRGYDVARDGRFLMRQRSPENVAERNRRMHPPTLRVILNWSAELQRPSGK